jgi:hypothetical protein
MDRSVSHWIQFSYERQDYLVDLTSIRFFARDASQRISFWLPDSAMPIVLMPHDHPDTYQQVLAFIDRRRDFHPNAYWVKLLYDRRDYFINLSAVRAFARQSSGRLTFWLPDNGQDIVLHPVVNAEAYQLVNDYIDKVILSPMMPISQSGIEELAEDHTSDESENHSSN